MIVVPAVVSAWLLAACAAVAVYAFAKWCVAPRADTSTAQRMFDCEQALARREPCQCCGADWVQVDETTTIDSDAGEDEWWMEVVTRTTYEIEHESSCFYARWADL